METTLKRVENMISGTHVKNRFNFYICKERTNLVFREHWAEPALWAEDVSRFNANTGEKSYPIPFI